MLAALIPILAPLILDAIEGWVTSGKLSSEDGKKAKKFFQDAAARSQAATDDLKKWLAEGE